MKITIITHYYPPEIGAPQARLSEMAKTWVSLGQEVTVVTCFPNHPTGKIPSDYMSNFRKYGRMSEIMNGVNVERCWVYATPNKGFVKKILGHLSFMVSAVVQGWKYVKMSDLVVVSSPTLFSAVSAWFLGMLFKKPYVIEVRDLWPAIFVELGVLKNKLIIKLLEKLELFLYKKAGLVIPVTTQFAKNIISRGIDKKKVQVITNGVDIDAYIPKDKNDALIEQLGLAGKFIVLYIGAHGISHALTKIIDAAEMLSSNSNIHFLLVGEGSEKDKIVDYVNLKGCKNVSCLPGQPKEMVPDFYSIMDVGLVPLRNVPLFDTFIPSKMFEIMAMEKPIVASVRGEAAEILKNSGAALIVEPENVQGIVDSIKTLFNDRNKARLLGKSGRNFVVHQFDRAKLASQYLELLVSCTSH